MNTTGSIKAFLSKKDNLLSVITIGIAIVLIFVDIFSDALNEQTTNEIIVIILALLAITNLIERETRFTETDKKIDNVLHLIQNDDSKIFLSNAEMPNLKSLVEGASEFFIAGGHSFNLITRNLDFWENWLKEGKSLKILIQNPSNEGLKYLDIPTYKYSYESYVKNLNLVIERAASLSEKDNYHLQIRLSNTCPTQGIIITDGNAGGKKMVISFYLPNCDSNSKPYVILEKERHSQWFNLFYSKYYDFLWEQSKPNDQ